MIGRFGRTLGDLLYPPQCLLCRDPVVAGPGAFCQSCAEAIERERAEPACPRCGASVAPFEVTDGECARCRRRPSRAHGTVRVGPYGTRLGAMLRHYKYRRHDFLGNKLAEWVAETVHDAPWRERIEAIVSVPTHWRRRLMRSVHVPEHLSAVLAARTGLPSVKILRRKRAGPHQIGLSYTERVANVRGAFVVRPGVVLNQARLVLVDDVRTTGATLDECARVLRNAGAVEVYAAVAVVVGTVPGDPLLLKSI